MKKLLIFFFVFLIGISLHAQLDFRNGFIITNEGDSIAGLIDYRSNARNYNSCLFKNSSGEVVEYFPKQLIGYGFSGDKFYTSEVLDGFFAEFLVNGTIGLFKKDANFYLRKDGEIHRLEYKGESVSSNYTIIPEDNRWRGVVSYLISDCLEKPGALTRQLPFKEKNLTNLIIQYNRCKGTKFQVFKANKAWVKYKFGASAGAALTELSIEDFSPLDDFDYLENTYESNNASFGVLMEISSPRVSERLAFQTEFHFFKSSYSSFIEIPKTAITEYHTSGFDLTTLSVPLSLKYTPIERKYGVFIQGGLNLDFHLKAESRLNTEVELRPTATVTTLPETIAFGISRSQTGIWGGIGIFRSFKKLQGIFAVRYFDFTTKLDNSEYREQGLNVTNSRITFNIILFKK